MTAPVYQSYTEAITGSASTVTLNKPSGVASGDTLILYVRCEKSNWTDGSGDGSFNATDDLPSGFTSLTRPGGGGPVIAWKTAGDSEPSTYTVDIPNASGAMAYLIRISGAHPSAPVVSISHGTTSYPSLTAVDNCLVLMFASQVGFYEFGTNKPTAPGNGFTVRDASFGYSDGDNGYDGHYTFSTKEVTTAGAVGSLTNHGYGGTPITSGLVIATGSVPPVINSSTTASGTQGTSFSYTITGTNTPTSYGATGLPAGLSVNTSTGAISGTPTVRGTYSVTINATNGAGTGTATLTLTLASAVPVISSNYYASGTQGQSFSYSIVATNTPTSYSASGLPTGLSVNSSTGAITGTPTAFGLFQATMTASNSWGSDTEDLVITIAPATAGALSAERWRLRGDAIPVAQVTEIVIPEGQGDISIEINGKVATFSSPTAASIATAWTTGPDGTPELAALGEDEFTDILATNNGTTLVLTAATAGKPFRLGRISLGGANPSNEMQRYSITNAPTGGTYTITLLGQTTSGIAPTATAAEVQAALEALPSVVPGDVLVVQPTAGVPTYELRFGGILAGTAVPAITVDRSSLTGGTAALAVTVVQEGVAPVNEVQTITIPGNTTGGTFTLSYAGQTTGNIAYNASNATIQTALQGLSTIGSGNATVSGGTIPTAPITVTFAGTLAGTNVAAITGDGTNLVSGSNPVSVSTTEQGTSSGGVGSVKFRLASPLTAGAQVRWKYTGPVSGDGSVIVTRTSGAFAWDASNSTIKAALEAMSVGYSTTDTVVPGIGVLPTGYVERTIGSGQTTLSGTLTTSSGLTVEFGGSDWQWHQSPVEDGGSNYLEIETVAGTLAAGPTRVAASVGRGGEIQRITNDSNVAGQFRLRVTLKGGGTVDTVPIDNRATAGTIVAAINTAIGENGVALAVASGSSLSTSSVLGTAVIDIRFRNFGYQNQNATQMTVIGDAVTVVTTTQGAAGVPERQTVSLTNNPWGGTIKLVRGTATSALAWDASAATVQSALEALAGVGSGNVVATGGPWPAPIGLTFAGSLGNLATITSQDNALRNAVVTVTEPVVGGVAITPRNARRSRGVNHWNDPLSWQNDAGEAGVPGFGDTVICDTGRTDLLYGLRQRVTCTADAAADELVLSEPDVFAVGQRVRLRTTGTLPSGLSTGTDYFVVFAADNRVRLSTSRGGAVVAISGAGSGTHTIEVILAVLRLRSNWTGKLGLPAVTAQTDGVREMLPQYLELGASEIEVGAGEGSGQQRIKIDVGPHQTACTVVSTAGASEPGLKAMLLLGSNSNNTLEVVRGDVGVAYYANESATLSKLTQRGGSVYLGRGVALGTLDKTGGTLTADGAVLDGAVNIRG